MNERHVFIQTDAGKMDTFIASPDGKGPFPGVVMYQNVGGMSDYLLGMARRMAEEGYYCILPDLYYRLGKIVIDADSREPDVMIIRKTAGGSVRTPGQVMGDTKFILEYMDKDPTVRRGPKGTIGYCMGGRFAPQAAETYPDVFKGVVSLFGTALMTDSPDSVHLGLEKIQGEAYFGFAEHDHAMPLDQVEEWKKFLQAKCTAKWQVEIHPGTEHGYAFPTRKVYHREASELSWQRAFALFDRTIR